MNKNEFIDSLLRMVKNKIMKEETKQSLSGFFANHPERNEVYLSGEKLFYNRGAAESYGVPVVKYTRQEVEAMRKQPAPASQAGEGDKQPEKASNKRDKAPATKQPEDASKKEDVGQEPAEEPADNQQNLIDTVDSRLSTVDEKEGKEE